MGGDSECFYYGIEKGFVNISSGYVLDKSRKFGVQGIVRKV